MATDNSGRTILSFLAGALLIGVAIVGFFMWDSYKSDTTASKPGITLNIKKS